MLWWRHRDPHGDADDPGGLSAKEWWRIAALLVIGLGLAALLLFVVPSWLVSDRDYRCPPPPATGQLTSSCLAPGAAGGIDHRALSEARAGARVPFGVFSAALLAGTAAAVGVIVSSHNARLTHRALSATSMANALTGQRDRDTAARERERAGDDRYTTAIDQLGHPAASVRLGAMHSLHRLARSDLGRLPTVVDVLCAYLRQPFHHPAHDWDPSQHPPDAEPPDRAWWPADQKERDERDSERQVRSTATRLMPDLLPPAPTPLHHGGAPRSPEADQAPPLEIDLTGAMLDDLDLSGRCTGSLRLDGAHIHGNLILDDGARIDGDLILGDGARIDGDLILGDGAYIHGDLWLGRGTHIDGNLILGDGARIHGNLWLRDGAHIHGNLRLRDGAQIDGNLRLSRGAHIRHDLRLDHDTHIHHDLSLDDGARIHGNLWLRDGAHIHGDLWLDDFARIHGDLWLSHGAHIHGNLWLSRGARIHGDLILGDGARIHGDLILGDGARIHGDLVTAETAVAGGVRLQQKAAMDRAWFRGWNVPIK